MKCPTNAFKPCSEGCPGWGWFDDSEVQRCDECRRFADDSDAVEHIARCAECRELLADWQAHNERMSRPDTYDGYDDEPVWDVKGRL